MDAEVVSQKEFAALCASGPCVIDTETTSLLRSEGRILAIGAAPPRGRRVSLYEVKQGEDLSWLKLPRMIAHNAPFDAGFLKAAGAEVNVVWDTMIMAHLLDENHPVGLKALGRRLLGVEDWSVDVSNAENLPRETLLRYLAMDVSVTAAILRKQAREARKVSARTPGHDPVKVMRSVVLPAALTLAEVEERGLPIDVARLGDSAEEVRKALLSANAELDQWVPERELWPQDSQRTGPKWGATNWTRWFLYEYLGLPVTSRGKPSKRYPEGAPSTAKDALAKLDHDAARALREVSRLQKLQNGFLTPLAGKVQNGRVYTSYRVCGTVTGRLSSADPGKHRPGVNSQQIPRDKAVKALFRPKGGWLWVEADFSQLELRVAAALAQEKTMLGLFADDEDIHSYMARQITGGEVTKEARSRAKPVNFGFLYGMTAKKFRDYALVGYGVSVTQDEADSLRAMYFSRFSGLEPWYKKQEEEAMRLGGVLNAFGRMRHLPDIFSQDWGERSAALRQAVNAPVQSTGSDLMLVALSRIENDELVKKAGARIVATVHDSVCLEAPPRWADRVAVRVKRIMEGAGDSLSLRIPIKADATVSAGWGTDPLFEA